MIKRQRKIRVLLAKVGLDGHERGVKVIAKGLMDAGMEVVYTGMYQNARSIIKAALEEDVDVLGVSCLSGGHINAFSQILQILREENKLDDILLIGGGSIPQEDAILLKKMGVLEIFRPGTKISEVVNFIETNIKKISPRFFKLSQEI